MMQRPIYRPLCEPPANSEPVSDCPHKPIFYQPGTTEIPHRLVRSEYTGRTASRKVWWLFRRVAVELKQTYINTRTHEEVVRYGWRFATMDDVIDMGEVLRGKNA